jgi:hypothetical protein
VMQQMLTDVFARSRATPLEMPDKTIKRGSSGDQAGEPGEASKPKRARIEAPTADGQRGGERVGRSRPQTEDKLTSRSERFAPIINQDNEHRKEREPVQERRNGKGRKG